MYVCVCVSVYVSECFSCGTNFYIYFCQLSFLKDNTYIHTD